MYTYRSYYSIINNYFYKFYIYFKFQIMCSFPNMKFINILCKIIKFR